MSELRLIYKQIPLIMGEVGAIEKTRQGQLNYKFRGIDDFLAAMQPLLSKHKVFFAPKVIGQAREERQTKNGGTMTYTILTMEFTFYAEDGSCFSLTTVGEAMDTSDKSSNKAMSAALKYALLQLFCVPTEEEKDTEHQHHEPTPRSKPEPSKPEASEDFNKPEHEPKITDKQRTRLFAIANDNEVPDGVVRSIVAEFGFTSSKDITWRSYDQIVKRIQDWNSTVSA